MASWRETPLEMDTQLARVTLKKKQQQQKTKQKRRNQKKKKNKRGKIKKKAFLYESSLGEIRLMTRPASGLVM